ncbi:MAG: hypothetical protein KY468_04615 [Armatimonadetes bacterium]|nr:hypothetical protein [Armatimonadota bacterium]
MNSGDAAEWFQRAEEFLWRNARLLERQLFAFHFKDGPREPVMQVLLAYRNADGGFGNALEPDIRCPDSQPVPTQHALEILDEIGWDDRIVRGVCDYLVTITTEEGGVPFVLPSVMGYPRAPWWQTEANPPASLNPTAALAGLLHKHGVEHPWLSGATDFCWKALENFDLAEPHALKTALVFLQYAPDRERAETEMRRVKEILVESGQIADVHAEGYVFKPLDWSPAPESPCHSLFNPTQIAAALDELLTRQREDGGWPIAWPAVGAGAEMEWRGWVTLSALKTLHAYGYG